MGKVLIFLSIVILLVMSAGESIAPQNSVFWLGSVPATYQHIRVVLAVILVTQFITRPPRHVWFRLLSGGVAAIAMGWAIQQTYLYLMQPLDTLAFLAASIAIIVTALERKAAKLKLYTLTTASAAK